MKLSRHTAWPWLATAVVLVGLAASNLAIHVSQDTYRYLFIIDITQSMNVSDMQIDGADTTRLKFVKAAIEGAFRNLPCGSEAGLGIFTAHRTFVMFTPVELCEHYRALSDMLQKIDWRMAWTARSEIAKGLYTAVESARDIGKDTRLVFLTDGHEAPPVNRNIMPPFEAEPGSVAGFIAGVGGAAPSRIPHLDDNDNVVGYWEHHEVMQIDIHSLGRAASERGEPMVGINMADIARRVALGQEHLSSLRERYLQELAAQTGLDYARVDSPVMFVKTLTRPTYARRTPVLTDIGWIPATLALAILVYCFIVVPGRSLHPT